MWTRRALLAGGAAGLVARTARAQASDRRLVLVVASGGWDVTYCLDPKRGVSGIEGPEVDQNPLDPEDIESVTTFSGIPIATNEARRPSVSAFFSRWAGEVAVVNGIHVGTIGHLASRHRVLTGTRYGQDAPDLAAIAGASLGADLPIGCLALSSLGLPAELAPSVVRIGARSQLAALLDDAPIPGEVTPPPAFSAAARADLARWRALRLDVLRERYGSSPRSAERLDDLAESQARGEILRTVADLSGLALWSPPSFDAQIRTAVDLLARDTCVAVLLDTGEDWDTHVETIAQHAMYDRTFERLALLASELELHGLLDRTLTVVISEMTRTPLRNGVGGKDHWPNTSALLFGGGIQGGVVLGGTGDSLEPLPIDLSTGALDPAGGVLTHDAFAAGILARLDIDPGEWLPGVTPWGR